MMTTEVDASLDEAGAIRVEVVYQIISTGAVERLEHVVSAAPR